MEKQNNLVKIADGLILNMNVIDMDFINKIKSIHPWTATTNTYLIQFKLLNDDTIYFGCFENISLTYVAISSLWKEIQKVIKSSDAKEKDLNINKDLYVFKLKQEEEEEEEDLREDIIKQEEEEEDLRKDLIKQEESNMINQLKQIGNVVLIKEVKDGNVMEEREEYID